MEEQADIRLVQDVETLRALAEPTRLAILYALLKPPWPRVMSVKELAAELDTAQTRLYRHIRQLEEADLIKVAETRMVSGILEHRYQASARDVQFGPDFVHSHPDESLIALHTLLDRFGRGLIGAPHEGAYKPVLLNSDMTLAPEHADELVRRLRSVRDFLNEAKEDPDGVPVSVLIGFYIGSA